MPIINTRKKPEPEWVQPETDWPFPAKVIEPPIPFEDFIEQIVDHNWAEFGDE